MAEQNHKTITGKVDRVVFHDQDSRRVILSIVREDGKSARIIGIVAKVEKGDTITAQGFWRKDEKFGWQFMAESIKNSSCYAIDDGQMNALDFSNVQEKRLRGFRETKGICDYREYKADDIVFPTIDGVVYNKDRTFLISAPEDIVSIEIPASVRRIGAGAFRGCNCLTSVTIGGSVSSIGRQAFAECQSLKSVHILDVSAWCRIKFGDAESNPISIAHTLMVNGEECKKLVIPDSVKSISDYAFYGCSSLESVSLPQGLEEIGIKAFAYCHNLEDLVVPSSVTNIYSGAFRECKNFRIDREFDVPWKCLKFSGNSISAEIKFSDYSENNIRRYLKPDSRYDYHFSLNADYEGVNDLLNSLKDIIEKTVPMLKIRMVSKDKGEIINADHLNKVVLQLKRDYFAEETREVSFNDIEFDFYRCEIKIKTPWGDSFILHDNTLSFDMDCIREDLGRLIPVFRVCYSFENIEVLNIDELHEITGVLDSKKVFVEGVIPERLKEIRIKYFRSLLPQTMSPYIEFLYEKHPICMYPIISVSDNYDLGALFTIIIRERPHIVWESFTDTKATYVFSCTNDNYEKKRDLIHHFITSYFDNKRSYLRSNSCKETFGEKPRMIVHNCFESWVQQLMDES